MDECGVKCQRDLRYVRQRRKKKSKVPKKEMNSRETEQEQEQESGKGGANVFQESTSLDSKERDRDREESLGHLSASNLGETQMQSNPPLVGSQVSTDVERER
ncbi:hypothetical protein ACJRO7_020032 [Eucalyptus globulus]|uniref:Uncharacterized protein n=1 Tax=Eucalyptus globulus TaxID=34317 RepID=A0ABD3KL42_EUCGL